jgi:phosphoglycolate phosphatase
MQRCLVCDLDGTLVDSAPDLAAAMNRLMASRGLAPFALPEVAAMVGDGVGVLLARAFAARDTVPDAAAAGDFIADYADHVADATRPYAGIVELVAHARAGGWLLAVCTNKTVALAHALLAATGLDGCFAAVGGGDSFPVRKPDPAHMLATLAAAGTAPERAIMLGDHRNDVLAAAGAGMACIFAGWGYGAGAMSEGAAAVAPSPGHVLALAERLLPPQNAAAATPTP